MRNYVLTLLLAVLVVLTAVTIRRGVLGTATRGADRRAGLVAIGSSPIPIPPPGVKTRQTR